MHTIEMVDEINGPDHDLTGWWAVRDEQLHVVAYVRTKAAALRVARLADGKMVEVS